MAFDGWGGHNALATMFQIDIYVSNNSPGGRRWNVFSPLFWDKSNCRVTSDYCIIQIVEHIMTYKCLYLLYHRHKTHWLHIHIVLCTNNTCQPVLSIHCSFLGCSSCSYPTEPCKGEWYGICVSTSTLLALLSN